MKAFTHYILVLVTVLSIQNMKAQSASGFDLTDGVSNIVLPNVFTPNYDSVNDIFKPILDEITDLEFAIFNRYGNLIFENKRLHGFWDGRTTTGEPCNDGVYFCVLTATGVDGKKYKEKTFIQLFTGGYYRQ